MNYEFEDYRKPKKEPELGPWSSYSVPKKFSVDYLIKMFLYLFKNLHKHDTLIPWLFGFQLTALGLLFNTVIFDYIYYRYIKYVTSSGV